MVDAAFKNVNFIFKSLGINARRADDTIPEGFWLNEDNCEELAENAIGPRLGTIINNRVGNAVIPLVPSGYSATQTAVPSAISTQGPSAPAWSNPANVISGVNFATVTVNNAGNTPSQQILAAAIAPSIPANAIISGFAVNISGSQTVPFGTGNVLNIALALSGTQVGTAKAIAMTTSNAGYTVGSSADLWGYAGWTAEEIIANLGIIVQAAAQTTGSTEFSINSLSITFYYNFPIVHSIQKLAGLNETAYRYAGCGGSLYRRSSLTQGIYSLLTTGLSGQPWGSAVYRPDISSMPYLFIGDLNGMLKDNGLLAAPQQMGIFQPQFPVQAQSQEPSIVVPLDPATGNAYSTTNITGFSSDVVIYPATTTGAAITAPGIQEVPVTGIPNPMGLFQFVTVDTGGNQEQVLVLWVTQSGFIANFTKTHASGVSVDGYGLSGTVASQTTGTIQAAFSGKPIPDSETNAFNQEDYIGLYMYLSDPTQIQQIILKFDCGDGSFESDYFYKVIGQGPLQDLLNTASQPTTAATDAILADALDIYGTSDGNLAQLNVGQDTWTPLLIQLSDFAGSGRADFSDPTYNWSNVNGYQITIVNNGTASILFQMTSMVLFGGAGPDTFAGVAYDYLFTFYNDNDGTESNPCMVMSNVNPPNQTNWVYPRRQPVLLTINLDTFAASGQLQDSQITAIRIYRRGGTLGDNYRRVDEIAVNIAAGGTVQYLDTSSDVDIEESDFVSFVNDVPVTSSLPNPVNTTLATALNPTGAGQILSVYPASMANISVRQQVSIGVIGSTANNFETMIVLTVASDHFTAFVQNAHVVGETISATAFYGQPVNIMAQAFGQMWFAGDTNNPHYLYYSAASNPQAVSSAAYVEVGTPDDPITVIVQFKGNLYVSTRKFWWSVAPGSNQNSTPTVYPTAAKHGCVAPLGWCATEEAIFYQSIDGIRAFAGGASSYLTQDLEFIFQGIGSSPIVEADQTQLSQSRMAYWNNMIFNSYIGVDGKRHRVILHTVYKRFRNDDLDVQSLLLEADTNTLVFGDSVGLVHIDRQDTATDEANNSNNQLTLAPIAMNLQTPYTDIGEPAIQKQFQEFTIDTNTQGQMLTITLWFEDGQSSLVLGTVKTTERQRVNFNIQNGDGYAAYKVSVQITGNVSQQVYIYQAGLKHLPLAKTRQSLDTYWLRFSDDGSKILKQIFVEYTAEDTITGNCYYDDSDTASFTFTLPQNSGIRNPMRVRLPAISFRMFRLILTSDRDFQVWEDSRAEVKNLTQGKGYQLQPFVPNG